MVGRSVERMERMKEPRKENKLVVVRAGKMENRMAETMGNGKVAQMDGEMVPTRVLMREPLGATTVGWMVRTTDGH